MARISDFEENCIAANPSIGISACPKKVAEISTRSAALQRACTHQMMIVPGRSGPRSMIFQTQKPPKKTLVT